MYGGCPEEVHVVTEFRQRNLPGFATLNSALRSFEAQTAFAWHLSLLMLCDDLAENRLPSNREQDLLYEFEDKIDRPLKANGNALFLARVTHDGRREIIWRIHDPEPADALLKDLLRTKEYPREFDYRIEYDPTWEKSKWYFENI